MCDDTMTAPTLDHLAARARSAWSASYGTRCVPWERATEESKRAWRAAVEAITTGDNTNQKGDLL